VTAPADDPTGLALVVFDFDGTLCDSADIKTKAFYELYLDEHGPEVAAALVDYHRRHAGVSRYEKIRWAEERLLGRRVTPERLRSMAARFSMLVEDAVVDAPLFPGVLPYLRDETLPVAIASATPTTELRRICDRKGITEFFWAIEGSPATKAEILSDYAARLRVGPKRMLMVGDQPSDLQAAVEVGARPLVVGPPAPWNRDVPRVDTFADVVAWIEARRGAETPEPPHTASR